MVMIPPGYPGTLPPQFPGFSGYGPPMGGSPMPFGPTGLEGMAGVGGGGTAVRAIAMGGQSVLPMMGAGALMATGMDPFSLGLKAIRGPGRMFFGGLAAGTLAGGYLAGKALDYGVQQVTTGAAREARLQTFLGGQFGFRGGQMRGMGGSEVADMSRALYDTAKDLDRTVSEVTRNLGTMQSLGLTRKIRDVQEFKTKMQETMKALDTISDTFNVSMQEAGKYLQGMRGAGFRDIRSQMAMLTPLRQAQWATGMTRTQVTAHMQAGTGLARMIGATGWRGAVGAQRALVGIGAAEQAGIVTEAMMEEATGLQGQEAVGAFSQIAQRALAQRVSTPYGRFFLAAGARDDMRRLDPEKLRAMLGGAYSMSDIKSQARGSVYGRGRKGMDRRFLMYEEEMRGQALQMGPQLLAGMVRAEVGERLHDTEDPRVNKMVRQAYGLSKRQAEAVLNMARRLPEMMAEELRQEESRVRHQRGGRVAAEGLAALKQSVSTWVRKTIDEPLQEYGAELHRTVTGMMAGTERAIFGGSAPRAPRFVMSRAAQVVAARRAMGGFRGATRSPYEGLGGAELVRRVGKRVPGTPTDLFDRLGPQTLEEDLRAVQEERDKRSPTAALHRMLMRGTGGWKEGGFLSEEDAATALQQKGLKEEAQKWLVSSHAMSTAQLAWGAGAFSAKVRGAIMGQAASMAGGRLTEYFKGAKTAEEYAARQAMLIPLTGLSGIYTAGGLGGGVSGATDYREQISNKAYGEMAKRVGLESGRGKSAMEFWREGYTMPEAIKKAKESERGSMRGAGALKDLITHEAYGPLILEALSGTEEERQKAMGELRVLGAKGMSGRSASVRQVLRFIEDGGEMGRADLFRLAQAELIHKPDEEYREITRSRMDRLRIDVGDQARLRKAGLWDQMNAMIERGRKGEVMGVADRSQSLAGLLTTYSTLDAKTRREMQGILGRQGSAGAEFNMAMGYVNEVMRSMGKGKMDDALKRKDLNKALTTMLNSKVELTDDMLKRMSDMSFGDFHKMIGGDVETAQQLFAKRGGGFTRKELLDITARRGGRLAQATGVGTAGLSAGANEAIAAELGDVGKGFGTSAGMHNEMRRQSSILLEIARNTSKITGGAGNTNANRFGGGRKTSKNAPSSDTDQGTANTRTQ